jgi:hypothetical protein
MKYYEMWQLLTASGMTKGVCDTQFVLHINSSKANIYTPIDVYIYVYINKHIIAVSLFISVSYSISRSLHKGRK